MARLLAALPENNRALWACAMYAGLRLGELQALRLDALDLARDPCPVIRVESSWDPKEGIVAPKSRAGVRTVPVIDVLRRHLLEHKLRLGWNEGYLFGRSAERPFSYTGTLSRARRAWKDAKLDPIGFHESRHSFVSLWHDAGVSLDRIGTYAGHSGSSITNRYRHLRDGRQAEDAALVNAYLDGLAPGLDHTGAAQAR
jgi:integrase